MLETPENSPQKKETPTVLPPAKIQTNNKHKHTYSIPQQILPLIIAL